MWLVIKKSWKVSNADGQTWKEEEGKEEDSDDHAGDDWGHGRPSILYTPNSLSGLSLVKVIYIPSAIKN